MTSKERRAKYYQGHKDRAKVQMKKWRAENPEKCRELHKRFKANNPDKSKEYGKRYYEKHGDEIKKKHSDYRRNNHDKVYGNHRWLKTSYGITKADKDRIIEYQQGLCPICKESLDKKRPCVDHDHTTGKIRGVLCTRCNSTIGFAKDSISILEGAINYLKFHKQKEEVQDNEKVSIED